MRPEVQVLPGPPPVLTSGNAGHRVRSSLARVGVGSRTLTWLPLPVMEPDDHYRGCGILLGVHDRRLLLYAPEQSRPLQPFTSTHREAVDRPRRTQPRLVCLTQALRGNDLYPVGVDTSLNLTRADGALSSGDALRYAVGAATSVVQVGPASWRSGHRHAGL